jgi:DNA-binding MarR family transcriptional regulator
MSRSPRLDDLLPYLMNRLVSRLNQNLSERLRRRGYSFQDWRILAVLAAHDGITLSQLAEAAVIPQPTVSRLVASLARRGLLRRRARAGDSRFIEARVTPRGRAAYRKMLPLAVDEYRGAVAGFDKAEAEWLRRATLRMIGNIGVELLKEVAAPGERKGNSKKRHSGSTAVASISNRASGSTRRVTSTTAMAGKCRPITAR